MPILDTGHEDWWLELKVNGFTKNKKGDTRKVLRDSSIEIPLHALPPDMILEFLELAIEHEVLTTEQAHQLLRDLNLTD